MTAKIDAWSRLQRWYLSACDGDWEHTYGIKIDTLDNPGWSVTVDLFETSWNQLAVARHREERSENDWIQYEVSDCRFVAYGGPLNLTELVELFLNLIELAPSASS